MDYYRDYDSEHAQRDMDARERAENAREARELADYYAGESPAYTAWLDETTPDAPGGRYEMAAEPEIDRATRRAPITGSRQQQEWREYMAIVSAQRAEHAARLARWSPIDDTTAGPILPEFDYSPVAVPPARKQVA